ncbi:MULTISPECIES: hypothetical protein [Ureibacillus]|uniref:Uncharacterized protein n=1 Tax=Ureibacillus thermosphaericus TaxID=51173 RepID=A0A840PNE7_URETH|nr:MULTISPECIES: hypothetical protein [Ureibacillus]MBB5149945.1 hypothetical protein [Ureibacillus thermosphaericus]MED3661093.1 hypothetical protein [Ureibacillus terrenus]NKZ32617.1 hypothetical protein [Ureibacillus thermosphaericus]
MLAVLTKRDDIVTAHMIYLSKLDDMGVSEKENEETIRFESPFKFNGEKVVGLVLPRVQNLKKGKKDLLELLVYFADIEKWKLEAMEEVKYDKINILFS